MDIAPYRLWHQALALSNPERWSQKVQAFFGPYNGLPFDQWWKNCEEYFLVPSFTVVPIASQEEADSCWGEYGEDQSVKLLYVNLYTPTSILVRDFERWLRENSANTPGRPDIDKTLVDFPLARHPQCGVIEKILRCHEVLLTDLKRPEDARSTLYQIGVSAGLSPEYVVKDANDRSLEAAEKRRLMSITTSRMLRRARTLIANVEKGVFPLY